MKSKMIDFRELLERVLPLEQLPRIGRLQVRRALETGLATEIERAGLQALEQLEEHGAVRRLETYDEGDHRVVRYQSRDAIDLITVRLPAPSEQDGVVRYPRATLPSRARGGLEQVRRLLRLDDPMLASDPRRADARTSLMTQLNEIGHELLGANDLRFRSAEDLASPGPEALDTAVARDASAHPDFVYHCPDSSRSLRLAAELERRRVRSAVWAAVHSTQDRTFGVLEVTSAEADAFRPDDLALVALLADYWASVLERATRIEKLVFIDPLTSVYNRSYFDLQVRNEMARAERERGSMALCIADIDDFKSFNTTYGFEAGNEVLIQVAQSLRHGVRPFDTVARWGGEEFAVLLTAPVQAHDVVTVSQRLRSLVERQSLRLEALDRRMHRVVVTVSIGVALFPDHAQSSNDLWRAANQALLEAKRPPKNQVVFFRPPEARLHQR